MSFLLVAQMLFIPFLHSAEQKKTDGSELHPSSPAFVFTESKFSGMDEEKCICVQTAASQETSDCRGLKKKVFLPELDSFQSRLKLATLRISTVKIFLYTLTLIHYILAMVYCTEETIRFISLSWIQTLNHKQTKN